MALGHQRLTKLVLTDEAGATVGLHGPGCLVLDLLLVVGVQLSYQRVEEALAVLVRMQL